MTTETCNEVLLAGTAQDAPALSHENHGARFYRFSLEVPRLSGQADVLPVLKHYMQEKAVVQGCVATLLVVSESSCALHVCG